MRRTWLLTTLTVLAVFNATRAGDDELDRKRIAVLPLTSEDQLLWRYGKPVSSMFINALLKQGTLVVDREQLDAHPVSSRTMTVRQRNERSKQVGVEPIVNLDQIGHLGTSLSWTKQDGHPVVKYVGKKYKRPFPEPAKYDPGFSDNMPLRQPQNFATRLR